MNILDLMNELGSRVRYGVGPSEKYQMMISQAVPGQPAPFLPGGAEENPEAVRYLSNYLGAQQWGQGPANLFNTVRYLADDDTQAYQSGLKGAKAGGKNSKLASLLMGLMR